MGAKDSPTIWLLVWTANNVGVTILNKSAFAHVDFKYPFFLSFVHMLCNSVGSALVFRRIEEENRRHTRGGGGGGAKGGRDDGGSSRPASAGSSGGGGAGGLQGLLGNIRRRDLDRTGRGMILAFSVVFSLNIAVGNVSLRHVSVNFNQVMRSLVPAITVAMGAALGRPVSRRRAAAVLPVVVGVAMACYGDMSYTALGFAITAGCVVLAALKVVVSGEMLTGKLRLHPVDLLGHMAPLATVQCLALSLLTGEVWGIAGRWGTELSPYVDPAPMSVVLVSGALSFSLNICSLMANRLTSPLTLCIAANVKQVLMIALSTAVFRTEITPTNGAGIVVVLLGSARYSYVSVLERRGGGGGGGAGVGGRPPSIGGGGTSPRPGGGFAETAESRGGPPLGGSVVTLEVGDYAVRDGADDEEAGRANGGARLWDSRERRDRAETEGLIERSPSIGSSSSLERRSTIASATGTVLRPGQSPGGSMRVV